MTVSNRLRRRLQAYAYKQKLIERQINLLAVIRLITFLVLIFGVSMLFGQATFQLGALVSLAAAAVFLYLMVRHDRCYRFKQQCKTLQTMLTQDLHRVNYELKSVEVAHPITLEPNHPFASDLDLVGPHGLLKLVDDSFHKRAKAWLSQWLNTVQDKATVEARQKAVAALSKRKRFRLRLGLAAKLDSHADLDSSQFQSWLATPTPWTLSLPSYILCRLWTLLTLSALFTRFVLDSDMLPWFPILLIQIAIFYGMDYAHRRFFLGFLEHGGSLRAAAAVIAPFESLKTQAGSLTDIQARLRRDGESAGVRLRQLVGIYDQLSLRQNGFGHFLLNTLFMWDQVQLRRLNAWRDANGKDLDVWFDSLFELEALAAIANFHWLFPDRIFPEITDDKTFLIDAEALGHPAIPDADRIGNRFLMVGGGKVHLITGSNMSGKSTFLRAIGTNLILARMGAPVCAKRFKTNQPLLWTSIRIEDSLAEGVSYFYAEVQRLKLLLEAVAASDRPVLFLLDEILKGTNSRERLIACKAMVQYLIDQGASGLITTHDLELLALEEAHPDAIAKYHFQEQIQDDKMFFDYRIKTGELTSTNALRVMRHAGVPLTFENDPS